MRLGNTLGIDDRPLASSNSRIIWAGGHVSSLIQRYTSGGRRRGEKQVSKSGSRGGTAVRMPSDGRVNWAICSQTCHSGSTTIQVTAAASDSAFLLISEMRPSPGNGRASTPSYQSPYAVTLSTDVNQRGCFMATCAVSWDQGSSVEGFKGFDLRCVTEIWKICQREEGQANASTTPPTVQGCHLQLPRCNSIKPAAEQGSLASPLPRTPSQIISSAESGCVRPAWLQL